jgi:methylenetetrahydrofolate dehydrogenase (NADP+)/methenyltetrahydrofolate cyclohydrolase
MLAGETPLSARILDGKSIAEQIKQEVAKETAELRNSGVQPGLTVVLVGNDPASEQYVRNKVKACELLGIRSEKITPPATISTAELLAIVKDLNARDYVDGILVQLPLPSQIDAQRVLLAVDPAKDVDGFHPVSIGNLVTQRPGMRSCTPAGILEMLKRYQVPIKGARAVVVGRSDIVGKPCAMLLLHEHATVTICHSRTTDLPGVCREADILVAAIGKAEMITADYIKPGATVIDVGSNQVADPTSPKGSRWTGDVHFPSAKEVAGAITPVPGGVGPLTIAMLMANTLKAFRLRRGATAVVA